MFDEGLSETESLLVRGGFHFVFWPAEREAGTPNEWRLKQRVEVDRSKSDLNGKSQLIYTVSLPCAFKTLGGFIKTKKELKQLLNFVLIRFGIL